MTSTPVALTINVTEANARTLPASLEARLNATPEKSPEDLAKDIAAAAERTAKLREAHLDAVRDRAARDVQRSKEAVARKLRLAALRVEKVQRKLEFAESKVSAKKEATAADREAKKTQREQLALAVAEARKAANDARAHRQAELLAAEKAAFSRANKNVNAIHEKGAIAVKHALAVATALKEKAMLDKQEKGDALASKLQAAETRRDLLNSPPSPGKKDRAARVSNEAFCRSETRRLALEASLAKASEKREAHIASVMTKAAAVTAKAAAVVEKQRAPLDTTSDKKALYEKMVNAETARLSALKAKYVTGKLHKETKDNIIVIKMDDVLTPRSPPASLITRLNVKSGALLETAAGRQAAAASRRQALKAKTLLGLEKGNAKRSLALVRIGKTKAEKKAQIDAKAAKALITLSLEQGKKMAVIEAEHKRVAAFAAKRAALLAGVVTTGAIAKAREADAANRHAKTILGIAKPGVTAVRNAAAKTRRNGLTEAVLAKAAIKNSKGMRAAEKRAALLAAAVELARKRMVAKHPKREVEDMEWSEA